MRYWRVYDIKLEQAVDFQQCSRKKDALVWLEVARENRRKGFIDGNPEDLIVVNQAELSFITGKLINKAEGDK